MCYAYHTKWAVGLIVVFSAVAVVPAAAKTAVAPAAAKSPSTVTANQDWIYATGEGAMPTPAEEPNRAKAYLEAKGYAKMQAIANLVQSVRGTVINFRADGSNYTSDESISQEVQGVVDNVRVISERKKQEGKDTIVEVTVGAPPPTSWRESAARQTPAGTQVAAASLSASWIPQPTAPAASNTLKRAMNEPYTSVIINALGYKVARSMSPKILRSDGVEVWGTVKADHNFISDYGIVAYARSLGEAYANPRAGRNPLVIRALRRGASPSQSDVVISPEDAKYLLEENKRVGFLSDYRVIFVVDASR